MMTQPARWLSAVEARTLGAFIMSGSSAQGGCQCWSPANRSAACALALRQLTFLHLSDASLIYLLRGPGKSWAGEAVPGVPAGRIQSHTQTQTSLSLCVMALRFPPSTSRHSSNFLSKEREQCVNEEF